MLRAKAFCWDGKAWALLAGWGLSQGELLDDDDEGIEDVIFAELESVGV